MASPCATPRASPRASARLSIHSRSALKAGLSGKVDIRVPPDAGLALEYECSTSRTSRGGDGHAQGHRSGAGIELLGTLVDGSAVVLAIEASDDPAPPRHVGNRVVLQAAPASSSQGEGPERGVVRVEMSDGKLVDFKATDPIPQGSKVLPVPRLTQAGSSLRVEVSRRLVELGMSPVARIHEIHLGVFGGAQAGDGRPGLAGWSPPARQHDPAPTGPGTTRTARPQRGRRRSAGPG